MENMYQSHNTNKRGKITLSFQLFMKSPNLPNKDLWEIQRNLCHCDYLVSLMPRTFRWSQSNLEVRRKIFERRLRRHFHNNAPWYSFFLFSFTVDTKENRSPDIRTNAKAFHTQTPRNIYIYIYIYRAQGVYKLTHNIQCAF